MPNEQDRLTFFLALDAERFARLELPRVITPDELGKIRDAMENLRVAHFKQLDAEAEIAILDGLEDGTIEMVGHSPEGEPVFRHTEKGKALAEQFLKDQDGG